MFCIQNSVAENPNDFSPLPCWRDWHIGPAHWTTTTMRSVMNRMLLQSILVVCSVFLGGVEAFSVGVPTTPRSSRLFQADTWEGDNSAVGGGVGSLQQIEFKIYPDGRVEETVHGVKGGKCLGVTEKINEVLGEVVASQPTEEMYEQEIVTDQTLYQSTSDSEWEGSSSW